MFPARTNLRSALDRLTITTGIAAPLVVVAPVAPLGAAFEQF
jgi:hypothetical protein